MSRPTSFLPEWLPTPANRRYRRRLGALRATIRDLVTERRAAGPPADPSAADDLLGTLVAAAKLGALDDEELVDNAVTFLFAGHETSALGLTYALYCLARRPAFQDRIRSEIAPLHGDPTPADLRECPALTAAVDEALRLYPRSTPFSGSRPSRSRSASTASRPGSCSRLHRGRSTATGAGGTLPRRTAPNAGSVRPRTAVSCTATTVPARRWGTPRTRLLPVRWGPRHCIGMRFARQELRLAVATILRRVRLEPVTEELSLQASANTRPDGPVHVRILTRDEPSDPESLDQDEPSKTSW